MRRSILLIGGVVIASLLVILLTALVTPLTRPEPDLFFRDLQPERALSPFAPFRFGPFGLPRFGPLGFVSRLAGLAFVYLSWVVLLFLFPERIGRMASTMLSTSLHTSALKGRLLAAGLAGLAATVLLNMLGFYTLVGIPAALALTLGMTLVVYAGLAGLAFGLGRWLRRRVGLEIASPLVDLGLGTLVVYTLGVIPLVGWIVIGLAAAYAFGAVLVTRFGSDLATSQPWSLRALEPAAQGEAKDDDPIAQDYVEQVNP